MSNYSDSQQVFVGNLPHDCQEEELSKLFSQWGKKIQPYSRLYPQAKRILMHG